MLCSIELAVGKRCVSQSIELHAIKLLLELHAIFVRVYQLAEFVLTHLYRQPLSFSQNTSV